VKETLLEEKEALKKLTERRKLQEVQEQIRRGFHHSPWKTEKLMEKEK
jgi:hypothetical protein